MANDETRIVQVSERTVVAVLCLLGACRVFLFSAAFPFFNNVDEGLHVDLVYRYSRGYLPDAGTDKLSPEFAEMMILYGSPEYGSKRDQFEHGVVPRPTWSHPKARETAAFRGALSLRLEQRNWNTNAFPVYYALGGLWHRTGELLGLEGCHLLYWIRFMNVPLFAVLVWLSYAFGCSFFGESAVHRLGLPLMVAFFPQDVFYSVTNDVLSPVLFATSFFMLIQLYTSRKSHLYHFFAGLVIAGTFLTKLSNITVLVLFGGIVLLKIVRVVHEKQFKKHLSRLGLLLVTVVTPISAWLLRNYLVLGSVTGAANKLEMLGWTVKPLGHLLDHPIFTPRGLFFFLTELTKTFWRGELVWHQQRIASASLDIFYVVTTGVFIVVSGVGLLVRRGKVNKRYRFVLAVGFAMVLVFVVLLGFLSLLYDFGNCPYPSREQPYFVSGRLMCGVLVPFLAIYLDGLSRLSLRLSRRFSPLVIVLLTAAIMTLSELWLSREVFTSFYNWFALR